MSEQEINEITETAAKRAAEKMGFLLKRVMTMDEAAQYLGISLSRLYKLTSTNAIPFYKPNGKMNYFEREELDAWILRNRVATNDEISDQARAMAARM